MGLPVIMHFTINKHVTMTKQELKEKADATSKNYVKDEGVFYIKLSDGRLWCPSLQARGTKYEYSEASLKALQNNSVRTLDFVAIDFETAKRNSNPCQIGIVVVRNGIIEESFSRYIKPKYNKYTKDTINIHHITPEMTENEPEFPEVWDEIKQYFDCEYIVAHNASFDIGVLQKTLDEYEIEYPVIRNWICTNELNNIMKLPIACAKYGIEFNEEEHHDGKYDAEACAKLYLAHVKGVKPVEGFNIEEEEAKLKAQKVETHTTRQKPSFLNHVLLHTIFKEKDLDNVENKNNPFFNKELVVTGEFDMFDGDKTKVGEKLHSMGAGFKSGPSKKVDFIIIGNHGAGESKLAKVDELNAKGANIVKITEAELANIFDGKNWEKYTKTQMLLF